MHIARRYTVAGQDPFVSVKFTARTSRIVNPDGTVVFEMKDLHAPEAWSQVAVDILAQKYFRRAAVPSAFVAVEGLPRTVRDKIDRPASRHTFIQTRYGVGYKLEPVDK